MVNLRALSKLSRSSGVAPTLVCNEEASKVAMTADIGFKNFFLGVGMTAGLLSNRANRTIYKYHFVALEKFKDTYNRWTNSHLDFTL
jgi:hypothetical protein